MILQDGASESIADPVEDATYSVRITARAYALLDEVRDAIANRPGQPRRPTIIDAVSLLIIEEHKRACSN